MSSRYQAARESFEAGHVLRSNRNELETVRRHRTDSSNSDSHIMKKDKDVSNESSNQKLCPTVYEMCRP